MSSAFDQWEAGGLSDEQALRALCSDLAELESDLAPLDAERADLRNQLSHVAARFSSPQVVPGFGRVELTAASVVTSYDKKALDELIILLNRDGDGRIAAQIAQCRTTSERAGSLRITREKQR